MNAPRDDKPIGAVSDRCDGKPGIAGSGSMVAPGSAIPHTPGSQLEQAADVLDGELITDAEYARRRSVYRLPVLAIAAGIRESDNAKKVITALASRVALVTLKDGRAQRLRALPATLVAGLRALYLVLCLLAGLLVMVGLWLEFTPGSIGWSGWWSLIRHILDGTLTALSPTVQALLWATLPALLVAVWREGRRAAQPPRWLFSPDERAQQDAEITADVITAALRHVRIPALTRYLTGGGMLEYVITPREQGGGTYTQVRLPMGVTAAELLSSAKVELLAGNLG